MPSYQPQIFVSAFRFMQAISAWVGRRYFFYIQGQIRVDKAERFAAKMNARYALDADRVERQNRRRKDLSNYVLVMFPIQNSASLQWFILRTDRGKPVNDGEPWMDARSDTSRIEFHGYRLTRKTVPRELAEAYRQDGRKISSKGAPWTWTMSRKLKGFWKSKIRKAGDHDKAVGGHQMLRQVVFALSNIHGHRGARADWFELDKSVGRQLPPEMRDPKIREQYGLHKPPRWGQFGTAKAVPLHVCSARYLAGETTWFPGVDRSRSRGETWAFGVSNKQPKGGARAS